ncbi:filamentous hemagglutinin N-terminal domain-containing protein [Argonema antarcticum]|uniref:two-partner secretion domain-containing protein n=1 Tax=Argonema antarcticum TaxID=2942763 RepID=UPI0020130E96|nr:filamentous hemagglutinin N-terminal domain-containing protein [Argonema antarcticum]MCL1471849.1 filamentous hemagglutinin N-terminal domain-containing protein [Argonema antarcticum A004/B2]
MSALRKSWSWTIGLASVSLLGGSIAISAFAAQAQVIPDTTLGSENTRLTTTNGNYQIDGGATRGQNLFHSFSQFSIPTGSGAYFNNDAVNILNIISRVTGGSISHIDGLIRANGTANLFLINPSGIIFGPNASLNIGGSFIGSTASSIKFSDGSFFGATNPSAPPLLTINTPIGLAFGPNPGNILVRGAGNNLSFDAVTYTIETKNRPVGLMVPLGQTLALVGGDVILEGGNLTAFRGRIELGSVGAGSLVTLTPLPPTSPSTRGSMWALDYAGVENFQDIRLAMAASADASGEGGGNIQVAGRRVMLTDGSAILALTQGAEAGGTLSVRASEVEALGSASDRLFASGFFTSVQAGGTGKAGNLTIETDRLLLADGAGLVADTFGAGDAGNLTVRATDIVELIGTIPGDRLPSGLFASVNPGATGNGGNLTVETARLRVVDGAAVATGSFGSGKAGSVTVRATDTVELIGTSPNGFYSSGLFTSVLPEATGDGGNLTVETARLRVVDGAQVSSETTGFGKAGDLTVRATDTVELIGTSPQGQFKSGLRALSTSDLAAGSLRIETLSLTIENGAEVTVSTTGLGTAGKLTVYADSILLSNSSSLSAETKAGGGDINLFASSLILRQRSNITTNAQGTATGGNITINADTLVALENSDINANAQDASGGKVTINTQGIFGTQYRPASILDTPESDITASSARGAEFSGTVTINTPDVNRASRLVESSPNLVDTTGLINQTCSVRWQQSRFAFTGSGGLPNNPYDALGGWYSLAGVSGMGGVGKQTLPVPSSPLSSPVTIEEAQGIVVTPDGRTMLVTSNQMSAIASANNLICHSP